MPEARPMSQHKKLSLPVLLVGGLALAALAFLALRGHGRSGATQAAQAGVPVARPGFTQGPEDFSGLQQQLGNLLQQLSQQPGAGTGPGGTAPPPPTSGGCPPGSHQVPLGILSFPGQPPPIGCIPSAPVSTPGWTFGSTITPGVSGVNQTPPGGWSPLLG